ncbi:radial spokehead-like protein-domain-containing protein [Obelidium mucronatum]|nr:radial spokehead-like protein-domain-containing protein [Obelidium mucronatum]
MDDQVDAPVPEATPSEAPVDAPKEEEPSPPSSAPANETPVAPESIATEAPVPVPSAAPVADEPSVHLAPQQTLVESTTPYLKRKDVYYKPEAELHEDVEFQLARSYLLQNSEKSEMNMYDHLTLTVMRVLETRPKNPIDIFESISSEIKRSKFRSVDPMSSAFRPAFDGLPGIKIAKTQIKLYEQPSQEDAPEEGLGEIPDIMDLSNLWEWAGVSFGREETFMLFLSLRKLVAEKPLKSVRLWGKIHGLNSSYIITEGELKDGANDEEGDAVNGIIISYPKFEGTEAQYLRCQIARISAATVASPAGYYTFDPEDEGNEEEGHQPTIIINPEFEGLPNDSLLMLSNWVHHVPYILPQGRVTWENPFASLAKNNEDGDEGGDDEEKEEGEGEEEENPAETAEPETGPPLLTPLANDEDAPEGGPAWVARPCSTLSPVSSRLWRFVVPDGQGAVVVAYNDKFANLYVGDGHGDVGKGMYLKDGLLLPPVLPEIAKEFEKGMVEQKDPTVEEETAFEEAKRAKEEEAKEAAEEGEEAAEEEED